MTQVDARSYAAAAEILKALGLTTIRLMTNNPKKCLELEAAGVTSPASKGEFAFQVDSEFGGALPFVSLRICSRMVLENVLAPNKESPGSQIHVVERVPLVTTPNEVNYRYLLTKQEKMGHLLNLPPDFVPTGPL